MADTKITAAINAVTKLLSEKANVKITPPPLTKDGGVVIYPEGGGTESITLSRTHARCFANVTIECKASTAETAFENAARLSECVSQPDFVQFRADNAVQILGVKVLSSPRLVSRTDDWIYAIQLRINYFY